MCVGGVYIHVYVVCVLVSLKDWSQMMVLKQVPVVGT